MVPWGFWLWEVSVKDIKLSGAGAEGMENLIHLSLLKITKIL